MRLECFVLGTSGSLPLPKRNLSSVLIRREGEEFLFDCGEGMQVGIRMVNVRWKHLRIICISHSHADHVTGLPGLLMLSSQVERDEPLYIACPRSVRDYIECTRKFLGMYINYDIHYIVLEDLENSLVLRGEDYELHAYEGEHSRRVWFFSLEEAPRPGKFYPEKAKALEVPQGELWAQLQSGKSVNFEGKTVHPTEVLGTQRNGRKIVYVTDTRPTEEVKTQIAGADMLFCESMFKDMHHLQALEKKHMTSTEVAKMCIEAGKIKRVGLLHFSPRYTFRDIKELEAEAQEICPQAFACEERSRIEIPHQDE